MAEKSGLVKSPFTITKAATGVTFLTADLVSVADWRTILSYSVPLGLAHEITPVNYHFGFLFATDTTTKITAGLSRILKQNANGAESREIWSGSNSIFLAVGDEFQRPKIRVPVVVNASQLIVAQVYNLGTTLDSVASDYHIETIQYYEEI